MFYWYIGTALSCSVAHFIQAVGKAGDDLARTLRVKVR